MIRRRAAIAAVSFASLAALGLAVASTGTRAASEAAVRAMEAKPFKVDGEHSSIVFAIRHNNLNDVYGRFNAYSGEFFIDAANPGASSISLTVDADSVDTGNEGRDKHVRNPDFFSTKEFPNATFKSTAFTKTGDTTFDVAGEFELHGVKKPVTAMVEYRGQGKGGRQGEFTVSGFVATLTIKRSEFGMTKYLQNLGDNVTLTVSIQGVQ